MSASFGSAVLCEMRFLARDFGRSRVSMAMENSLMPHNPTARRAWTLTLAFELALIACGAFVVLTGLAMRFYPGGTALDSGSVGYHFWSNFFSDLGRTHARNGAPNRVSSLLFQCALSAAGAALAIFHLGLARLLWTGALRRALGADCAIVGLGACGAAAGVCFVGVALKTADVAPYWHAFYVVWAFRFFLAASLFSASVISAQKRFPRALAWITAVFTVLLLAYLVLIARGPSPATLRGLMIQATSQKLIVYAAIASVGAQAWMARRTV